MTMTEPTPADLDPDVIENHCPECGEYESECSCDEPDEEVGTPIVGELVKHDEQRTDDSAHSAIEAAARAALEQPGIPGRDEFLSLAMQARIMAGSNLVPKALQNKPADVFLVLLTGRDIGIPITSALRKVHVIEGQTSLAPQLKLAIVRRQGLGSVVPVWGGTDQWQAAQAVGPGGLDAKCVRANGRAEARGEDPPGHLDECVCDLLGPPIVFTLEDATAAGLTSKKNWTSYPRRMLWWRAAGYAVDDYFPEVGMGLYSPDELGAMTDEEGRPIDPATVELPEGFEDAARRTGGAAVRAAAEAAAHEPAPAEVVEELLARARALPPEQAEMLKAKWRESERLAPFTLATVPAGQVAFVNSMLNGFEALAARAARDQQAAPTSPLEAPVTTSEPEDAPSDPDSVEGNVAGPTSESECELCGATGDLVLEALEEGIAVCSTCDAMADGEGSAMGDA